MGIVAGYLLLPPALNASQPGRLDLSHWDFTRQGLAPLNHQWDFFWNELIYPDPFYAEAKQAQLIEVPMDWNDFVLNDQRLGANGYATYRLRVFVEKGQTQMALKIVTIKTNFNIFVNGVQVASNGRVGETEGDGPGRRHPLMVSDSFKGEVLDIVVQVSNYRQAKGGLIQSIYLGPSGMVRRSVLNDIALDLVLFGCILIIGIYHLLIFFFRKTDRASLYFSLICFLFSLRTLFMGARFANHLFPELSLDLSLTIEYLSVYISLPIFSAFIYHLFPREFSKAGLKFIAVIALSLSMPVIALSEQWFRSTLLPFEVLAMATLIYIGYVLVRAIGKKREGAWLTLGGYLFLFITSINDALYDSGIIDTGFVLPIGLLGYIIFQALHLSYRSARNLEHNEQLTRQFAEVNKRLEQRVRDRTRELKSRNEQLQQEIKKHRQTAEKLAEAKMAAEEASQAKSDFLANMSHELRTPMHGILGFAKFGIDRIDRLDKQSLLDFFKEIKSCGDRLLLLLNDLLDLSKLESGKIIYEFDEYNLKTIVETVLKEFSAIASEKNMSFQTEMIEGEASAVLDEGKIIQVTRNLLSNAIKYSPADTMVTLRLEGDEDKITLAVIDQGIGIPEDELEDVFDKFVQSSKTKTAAGGTGLGLPICYRIVSDHKGRIWAENNDSVGTTFTVELPRKQKAKKKLGEILVEQKLITRVELEESLKTQSH